MSTSRAWRWAGLRKLRSRAPAHRPACKTATIPITAYAHVRLTVTDIDASRAFYDALFGLPVAFAVPEDADAETCGQLGFLFGGVIYRLGDTLLGLRPMADDAFDENRVGLDHLAFTVEDKDVLDDAVKQLDDRGIQHAGVKDIDMGHILEFRDPDGIALELFAPTA
ncbi:VOC family protein [Arthrobacter antioxidans]|uniref:VOC family protein n=1 Tax=Arthrobacter antioxidans TaxID=2895818 RepID=UPI0020002F51|nr:VOC family protein [Arthrobacter antioxidans]